jgi:hypothetical protein
MNTDRPNIDELLDTALQRFSAVEPRSGLERRVLARLRAVEPPQHRTWWWSVVAFTVASAVLFLVAYPPFPTSEPAFVSISRTTPPYPSIPLARSSVPTSEGSQRVASNPKKLSTAEPPQVVSEPKAEQFPSPAPLSEQEQMLARYVVEHRDRAVLVARAQTELFRMQRERDANESGQHDQDLPHTTR